MMFQPPFPDPVPNNTTGEALVSMGFMSWHFILLFFMIILMVYCYRRFRNILPIIVLYMLSLLIGFESLIHAHPPLSPNIEIFFLLFQTAVLIVSAVEYYEFQNKIKEK